jgi:hypothetical protein
MREFNPNVLGLKVGRMKIFHYFIIIMKLCFNYSTN